MRFVISIALLAGCFSSEQMVERDEDDLPVIEQMPRGDFATFIACMQFEDFVAADMAGAWASVKSATGACTACHATDGMFSGDARRFFDDLKHRTYLQVQLFTFDREADVVGVNTETIPNIGKAVAPYVEHPRFNATKGLDATFDLYDRTLARLAAGDCR